MLHKQLDIVWEIPTKLSNVLFNSNNVSSTSINNPTASVNINNNNMAIEDLDISQIPQTPPPSILINPSPHTEAIIINNLTTSAANIHNTDNIIQQTIESNTEASETEDMNIISLATRSIKLSALLTKSGGLTNPNITNPAPTRSNGLSSSIEIVNPIRPNSNNSNYDDDEMVTNIYDDEIDDGNIADEEFEEVYHKSIPPSPSLRSMFFWCLGWGAYEVSTKLEARFSSKC